MSEEKETTAVPSEQNPNEAGVKVNKDLEEAVKKGDDDLENAEKAFNKAFDGATARVDDAVLRDIARIGGWKPTIDHEAIKHVNSDKLFNFEEFRHLIKLLEEPGEEGQKEKIVKNLKNAGEETKEIVVHGKEGVGKTWMAREVAALAVRDRNSGLDFDVAIWVYLDRNYEGLSLHESIAYQLSVLADFEKSEAEEAKKKEKADEAKKPKKKDKAGMAEEAVRKKKDKAEMAEEVVRKKKKMETGYISEALKGKKLLFIMDGGESEVEAKVTVETREKGKRGDHGHKEKEKEKDKDKEKSSSDESGKKEEGITEEGANKEGEEETEKRKKHEKKETEKIFILELKAKGEEKEKARVELGCLKSYKSLITTRREAVDGILMKPCTWKDSKLLVSQVMKREDVVEKEEITELAHYFMFRSERLPSQLLLIGRIVSYFVEKENIQKLRDDRDLLKKGRGEKLFDVLIKGYDRLPKSVLIDRYSTETPQGHFLHRGRNVSFNELICYWIMEGHLGQFSRVEEAYMEGHRVLMELMNCGLLQKQEGDYVVATSGATKFKLDIHDYEEFFRSIRPGLAVTFDMRLGRVALAEGMIKTVERFTLQDEKTEKEEIISTLLLDGNLIGETHPPAKTLIKYKDQVEVLSISDPTGQHFKLPILEMQELRLLTLRGCQFFGRCKEPSSLERFFQEKKSQEDLKKTEIDSKIPQEDLKKTEIDSKIQRMENLTFLEISGKSSLEYIPDSLFSQFMSNLKTLNLSYLDNIKLLPKSFYDLTQIEFLILRGCESLTELRSLKKFINLKILDVSEAKNFEKFEDKSLHTNEKLQVLNLSKTKLKTLPLINQLNELKYVWLSDCTVLPRIRKIDRMKNLQIFDISGAKEVERFCDPSLEDLTSLVIVDISRTAIKRMPANMGDPTYLYAKDCHKLKVVPPVEGLKRLQVLDLSGCSLLEDIRKEFFTDVKGLIKLDLSKTRVKELSFLSYLLSLRTLLMSECVHLTKLENLSGLKELEFLDLSGCKELMELENKAFDKMIHLQRLYLSGTGLGGDKMPSLSNLKNLKELLVRDCPNLTKLPDVEQLQNLQVLECSGTVLKSPPFSNLNKQTHVHGSDIESVYTSQMMKNLGVAQWSGDHAKWEFEYKEVSECRWNISNWRIERVGEDKLGTQVYGAHFLRLLKEYPSFLTEEYLSTFRFLVYPSKARFPGDFETSYIDELMLRDIYFKQICDEKMERSLEIRGFEELPESLRPLIARAQLIVVVDGLFLKSLINLGVDTSMDMKACWIESCNQLEHVVEAAEKSEEAAKSKDEQGKNVVAGKTGDAAKSKGDEQTNAAAEKLEKAAKIEGDQQKNVAGEKSEESTKSEDDQHKNDGAAEPSRDSARSEGDEQKPDDAENNSGESANGGGDQQKSDVVDAKSEESTKSENDQQKSDVVAAKSEESTQSEDDQQKNATEEKSEESAQSEVSQKKSDGVVDPSTDSAKREGDEQKTDDAADTSGESAKGKDDQQKSDVVAAKSGESAKSEGKDDQQKNVAAAEKSGDEAKSEDNQQQNVAADKNPKNEGDQQKNVGGESTKQSSCDETSKSDEKEKQRNDAENLSKLETLWISDASKMMSVCKGDIQSVSFKLLKSLYLEHCPKLTVICSSYLQLEALETLHVKYCHKLKTLFSDENPSKMEKLRKMQLWGLNSLEKIGLKAPALNKLRVGECPLLEHVIASRQTEAETKNEGHGNLEILHIKSCDKLTSIFDSTEAVHFEKLTELKLVGLPGLKRVAREATALRILSVGDCPSLESIIAGPSGLPNLEKLEVKSCAKLRRIIEGGGESKMEKVKEMKLLGLPELDNIGAQLLISHAAARDVRACPKIPNGSMHEKIEGDFA